MMVPPDNHDAIVMMMIIINSKAVSYKDARECIARFLEKNQSVVCRDLKGVETGNVLRACPDCISDAVEIIGEVLF